MNGYIGYYKSKKYEVYANTTREAQDKIAKIAKARKSYEVTVVLAEKNGKEVTHSTCSI